RPDVYGASDCCNKGAGSRCLLWYVTELSDNVSDNVPDGARPRMRRVRQATGRVRRQRLLQQGRWLQVSAVALCVASDRTCTAPATAVTRALAPGLVCGKRPDVYGASDCCNKGAGSRCLVCGKRPDVYGASDCCNKGAGSSGIGVIFVLGGAVALVLAAYFLVGVAEPRDKRVFEAVDKFVDLEKVLFNEHRDPHFNVTSVLLDCHANRTLYKSLHLHRLYDLEAVRAEVEREVSARVSALRPTFPHSGATILGGAARDKLTQLAETGLSDFDFDKILHARTALRLRDSLRFNHTSLKTAIEYLMHEATEAETFLNRQGPDRLLNMTREFASVIELRLNEYLERVQAAAYTQVGRCGPLSNAFNATRDAACNKILMPTRLARLYLHLDPYPGPLVEAEYLYDAYADRDNVPLANGSKRSTLDIEGKIAEWRERSAPLPSAPPDPSPPAGTRLLLAGDDVVCRLVPPALLDDLKTRLDSKDEDNESGIHESE
ncbi:putative Prominin-like protein, partial [Operophtera brumata]